MPPYTILSLETRLPTLTPTAFASYYENTHVPIIKSAVGSAFPVSHARYYIKRQPDSTSPLVFIGDPGKVDYDAVVVMTFESEEHMGEFQRMYAGEEGRVIRESAEKFIVASELVVVGMEEARITYA